MIGVCFHDVFHVGPPFLHYGVMGEKVEPGLVFDLQDAKQNTRLLIEEYGVCVYTGFFQKRTQRGPDGIMPSFVLGFMSANQFHLEGEAFHFVICGEFMGCGEFTV